MENYIYHLVSEEEFKNLLKDGYYLPLRFENDGFIHCSSENSVISVAEAYYSKIMDLILLKLDKNKIESVVKYEDPAPVEGTGNKHIQNSVKFPHIYGPLNQSAICGIGKMINSDGKYKWPNEFIMINKTYNID